MTTRDIILTLAIMLVAGLLAELVAGALRVPRMLALLAAGTILGPTATGWIDVPLRSEGAQLVFTLGVSIILFYGGLGLSVRVLKRVVVGLGLLAIPGVILTALVTGAVAAAAFDLPISMGFLIGAVLAPTDPAILIPLFERLGLRPKLSQTIIAESALNDPIGAVLALSLAGVVLSGHSSFGEPAADFVEEVAISSALGVVFGLALSLVVSNRRAGVWSQSAPVAVLAAIAGSYFTVDYAGGSGYLGAALAGLIVGNMGHLRLAMHSEHEHEMRAVVKVSAEVMVMLIFVTLGANLPWREIGEEFLPALAVLVTLLLVARPIAVLACLLPDRRGAWTRNEILFVSWTRETGVVPAALAGLIVSLGVPNADLVVTTVALAVILTLVVQSTTKAWLARRLSLLEPAPPDRVIVPASGVRPP